MGSGRSRIWTMRPLSGPCPTLEGFAPHLAGMLAEQHKQHHFGDCHEPLFEGFHRDLLGRFCLPLSNIRDFGDPGQLTPRRG